MANLTIWKNNRSRRVPFEGTPALQSVLADAGLAVQQPCGGRGKCGKCAVRVEGMVSAPNSAEQKAGHRLACQVQLLGDAAVWLPDDQKFSVEVSGNAGRILNPLACSVGAAIDIGTTTLALKLCVVSSGSIAASGCMNPQRSVSADVMGRIGAAMNGQGPRMREMVIGAIENMLKDACREAGCQISDVEWLVISGNTTMLYLLTGRNPENLSHAPFEADTLFGFSTEILGIKTYLTRCMNAFVGGDITCAVLSSTMTDHPDTALLCDIGTNGEIALWKGGRLYVTSTAAGPAFEGAGISCGCSSVPGAIDRVWTENSELKIHTIDSAPAVGICGSGLIDAVAAFLKTEQIDETGACDEDQLNLTDSVFLSKQDIRSVQLAKAAIAAGIETLLELSGTDIEEIGTFYIAGGFGRHLDVRSAAAIGLIPEQLTGKAVVLGNAALSGALEMLLDREKIKESENIAQNAVHVNLGGNPVFNEYYMENMLFPEEDEE